MIGRSEPKNEKDPREIPSFDRVKKKKDLNFDSVEIYCVG